MTEWCKECGGEGRKRMREGAFKIDYVCRRCDGSGREPVAEEPSPVSADRRIPRYPDA